jgi:hypothetical protein
MSKFLPGNNMNPKGRPKTAFKDDFDQLQAKKKMFDEGLQVYKENYQDIIVAMCNQAIKGNVPAAVYLRDSFLGKPKETVVHDIDEDAKQGLRLAYSISGK